MGQSESAHGFPDCRAFLDRCIAAERGGKLIFKNKGSATAFSRRCYTARHREKKRNIKLFPVDDPMHNATAWDILTLRVLEGQTGTWELHAIHDGDAALESLQATYEDL